MTMPPQTNGQSAIVTLTMNPALDITTNADTSVTPTRSVVREPVTMPVAAEST